MAFERREYSGNAVPATLNANIGTDLTPFNVSVTTGWPDASDGPFAIIIDEELATEEKILIGTRVGTTLTPIQRGYDNTAPVGHLAGAKVEHTITATDFDEANFHLANQLHDHHSQYLNPARHNAEIHQIDTIELVDGAVTYAKLSAGQRWEPGDFKQGIQAADHAGWLLCDGRTVLIATYPALWAAMGSAHIFGADPGGAGFRLPDLRKKVLLNKAAAGVGSTLGGSGGTADAVVVAHGHLADDHTHGGNTAGHSTTHWHGLGGHVHYVPGVGNHSHKTTRDDHSPPIIAIGSADALTQTNKTIQATSDAGHTTRTSDDGGHDHGNTHGPSGGSDAADRDHSHGFTTGGASDRDVQSAGVSGTDQNLPPFMAVNGFIHT